MFKEINILKPLFDSPNREFNVRELARILKMAPATASKDLKLLSKKGILKQRKDRNFIFYKANLESDFYRDLKIFYNLRKIKDSGLIGSLDKFYLRPSIVLFGSMSNGLDNETSDVDLLVLSEKTSDFLELKKFERLLGKKIQLFIVKNLKELKNEHLINNLVNGIIIQGEIKWI